MTHPYHAATIDTVPANCHSFRTSADGLEKRCACCKEWWPADSVFFSQHDGRPGGLAFQCRACTGEEQAASRQRKRPAVSGRTPPMHLLASVAWLGTLARPQA